MSPNSPFAAQLNSKDERFKHFATPRTAGGSTARWNPKNYVVHKVSKVDGLSSESPFKSAAKAEKGHFSRSGPKGWKSTDYKIIKAQGAQGLTKEESPFYAKPEDMDPKHFTRRGASKWSEKDYRAFTVSKGTVSTQKHPLSDMKMDDTPRGRFGGLRNQRKWAEGEYRAFKKTPAPSGANGDASPFSNMIDPNTPRTRVRNQYMRNGRAGDFNMNAAQASFSENQKEAKRIQKATNGHGKGGAGEAIFGGGKQPGAVSKRKMKGATIFIDGVADESGH